MLSENLDVTSWPLLCVGELCDHLLICYLVSCKAVCFCNLMSACNSLHRCAELGALPLACLRLPPAENTMSEGTKQFNTPMLNPQV